MSIAEDPQMRWILSGDRLHCGEDGLPITLCGLDAIRSVDTQVLGDFSREPVDLFCNICRERLSVLRVCLHGRLAESRAACRRAIDDESADQNERIFDYLEQLSLFAIMGREL